VDRRLLIQLGILDVFVQTAIGVNAEHIQEACMVIEWVAIDVIWRELGCQDEDCTGLGIGIVCSGWM